MCIFISRWIVNVQITSRREEKKHEGQKEKVTLLEVTGGGISRREIAAYRFCDRGNVNWPYECVTSLRGGKRTKWTQNSPWEGSELI